MEKKTSLGKRKEEEDRDESVPEQLDSKKQKIVTKSSKEEVKEGSDVLSSPLTAIAMPENLKSVEDFQKQFSAIANRLLNEFELVIASKPHRLAEIEFYWKGSGHSDIFAHGDPDQKKGGTWYFHKAGKGYKGGTYKGLDIAFGNANAFGGILIRSIKEMASNKLVDGSCMCVDHILKLNKVATIEGLVQTFDSSLESKSGTSPLYLRHAPGMEKKTVLTSARVGLTLKKNDDLPGRYFFIGQKYRYFVDPKDIKKGKPNMVAALCGEGKSVDEIVKLVGSTKGSVQKICEAYNRGLKKGIESYRGALNADQTAEMFGAADAHVNTL